MSRLFHSLFLSGFLLSFCFLISQSALAESTPSDCTGNWEVFYSQSYKGFLCPDTDNTYRRLRFEVPADSTMALKVTGDFPHARYIDFNVYDQDTLNSTGTLADRAIQPDPGNENPFWNGVSRDITARHYTIYVVPHGMTGMVPANSNVIELPAAHKTTLRAELWYRLYFPDQGSDLYGNVGLPKVTAFDLTSGASVQCPKKKHVFPSSLFNATGNVVPAPTGGNIFFLNDAAQSIYSDPMVGYLLGRLPRNKRLVSVFRFRAPSFSNTYSGSGVFDGAQETRYFSLCLVGLSTLTSSCLPDSKIHVGADGFITAAVGPTSIQSSAEEDGINFLPRGRFIVPFVFYRNLLPATSFVGNFDLVPKWFSKNASVETDNARNFIGDFAPQGRYCSEEEFVKDRCGIFDGTN